MNFAPKGKTPTTEATKNSIKYQLENAQPTLKTSDYYTLYLGHSYKMPTHRTFMTLDFWISFIGEKEANEHLQIMIKTNEAFTIFEVCEDSKFTNSEEVAPIMDKIFNLGNSNSDEL